MTFPTGWTQRFALTVDKTKVTGTPTGFILLITSSMFPSANIDASGTSAQDGGGDIRVTTDLAGTNRLPIEVVDFHPDAVAGNRRCEIWVNCNGFEPSSSVDTTYYVWCKGPNTMQQPAPSMPYGAEAVWTSQDYRAVHHGNNAALPEPYGLWLIRPKAVEYNGATYVTWMDANHGGTGNIRVAKYTHSTGLWTTAVTVAAAELIDAHGAPSICVDTSGFIHVVWCGFNATNQVVKTAKSSSAQSIGAWDGVVTVATGGGATDRTYPTMLCLSSGTLVLFSRDTDAWTRRVSTDNGTTWGSAQVIITVPRAYTEWVLGASDRVHLAWHTSAGGGATNGVNGYYLYSDNSDAATSTWKAIDGTTATLPLASDTPTTVSTGRVFSASGLGFDSDYLRGIAVNGSNSPMLSFDGFVGGVLGASSAAMSFTYNGSSWVRVNILTGATVGIVSSGSLPRAEGGVRFLSGTTWRALLGLTASGVTEVQEWETTDGGANWSKAADVTVSSNRGNWQAQYVRGSTGPLVATHFTTSLSNNTGAVFNSVSDAIWIYGSHTDGVASAAPAIPVTTYLRDSTKYHNDATAVGSPSQTAGPATYGGFGQSVTSVNYYSIANATTISGDLASSLHIQQWIRHTSAGSAEKASCKNASAGTGTPWVTYRDGSNNMTVFFGSASTFVAPTSSGGASGTYRGVYQFGSNSGSARLNKTAIGGLALTGPLATVSDPIHLGETLIGVIDEFRIGPTRPGANTLDTEYDNQNAPSTFASSSATALASNSIRNFIWMG